MFTEVDHVSRTINHSGIAGPTLGNVNRLTHEYELQRYLDRAWALRPLELRRERGQTLLVVDYMSRLPATRSRALRPVLRNNRSGATE